MLYAFFLYLPFFLFIGCQNLNDTSLKCTEKGCENGWKLNFKKASWPAGNYKVHMTIDGKATQCSIRLPAQCGEIPTCKPETHRWLINEGSCTDKQSLTGLHINLVSMKNVSIQLDFPGISKEKTFQPALNGIYANGFQCGLTCVQAEAVEWNLDTNAFN